MLVSAKCCHRDRLLSRPVINGHKLGGTAQEAEGSNGRSAASLVRATRRLYLVCSSLGCEEEIAEKKRGRHFFRTNVTRDKGKLRFKAKEAERGSEQLVGKTRHSFGAGRKSFHPSAVFFLLLFRLILTQRPPFFLPSQI
jgi:hypothetical protein